MCLMFSDASTENYDPARIVELTEKTGGVFHIFPLCHDFSGAIGRNHLVSSRSLG
jgi:hypothetical protein